MKAALPLAAVAALVASLLLIYWRELFVQHAVLVGLAIGALTYYMVGTVRRLKQIYGGEGGRWRAERDDS